MMKIISSATLFALMKCMCVLPLCLHIYIPYGLHVYINNKNAYDVMQENR